MEAKILPWRFDKMELQLVQDGFGACWIPGEEVGQALGYSHPRLAIGKLYRRNQDILDDPAYSFETDLVSEAGLRKTRVYNLEGVNLLLMYSRQPKAREFQKAVAKKLAAEQRAFIENALTENTRLKEALGDDRYALEHKAWREEERAKKAEESLKTWKHIADLYSQATGIHPEAYQWANVYRILEVSAMPLKSIAWTPGRRVLRLSFKV